MRKPELCDQLSLSGERPSFFSGGANAFSMTLNRSGKRRAIATMILRSCRSSSLRQTRDAQALCG